MSWQSPADKIVIARYNVIHQDFELTVLTESTENETALYYRDPEM
jgi:hypothetical protein